MLCCRFPLAYLISLLLLSEPLFAKQIKFSQQTLNDGRLLTYQWSDKDRQAQSLQFKLSNTALMSMPKTGAAYRPQLAQRAIKMKLLEQARLIDPRDAKVTIKQQGASINIQVNSTKPGEAQRISNMLASKRDEAQMQYLRDNYYLPYQNHFGQEAIKHDHARYAQMSAQGVSVVADALKQSLEQPDDFRAFVNLALSWIQSIPYDTLENRISSNGSGFASPKQLLLGNKGDCDSKSTLLAAILKAYSERIDVRMIYLPNHALLALKMRPNKNDESIKIKQQSFVLLEPTGPAFYPLGEIAPSSKTALRNRQYSSEKM